MHAGSRSGLFMTAQNATRAPTPLRPAEAIRSAAPVLAMIAALSQISALTIAAWLNFLGGRTTILHFNTPSGDATAWRSPAGGFWGSAATAGEAFSILLALCAAVWAPRALRHAGHTVLGAWILFWLCRTTVVALAVGGWELWTIAAACLLAAAAQFLWWFAGPPRPAITPPWSA